MPDITIKQHDTWPPLKATLSDSVGPVNLTGATVKVILKDNNLISPTTIIGNCTLVDAANGKVAYTWTAPDTANVNTFNGEFEVTWGDSTITTFPNVGYFTLAMVADLG